MTLAFRTFGGPMMTRGSRCAVGLAALALFAAPASCGTADAVTATDAGTDAAVAPQDTGADTTVVPSDTGVDSTVPDDGLDTSKPDTGVDTSLADTAADSTVADTTVPDTGPPICMFDNMSTTFDNCVFAP